MLPLSPAFRYVGAALLLTTLTASAVPTAVPDNYTTPQDTPAGNTAVDVINTGFEGSGGGITFMLPNAWQIIDLATTAAGGTNTYPQDAGARPWYVAAFDSSTSTIAGWRSGTLPVRGGSIDNANFSAVPATLTGLVPGGPNTVNTYLVRNQFILTAAQAAHPTWDFTLLADDGCVIYVNGVEMARLNLPVTPTLNPDDLTGGGRRATRPTTPPCK